MAKKKTVKQSKPVNPWAMEVTVAISFCDKEDNEQMLRYALRSVEKNLVGVDANVLVFGNSKPSFISDDAFIKVDADSFITPEGQWKLADALLTNADVKERIVLMRPDQVLCEPCLLADIAVLKASHNTTPTISKMKALGYTAVCFDTDMPVLIYKSMINEVAAIDGIRECELRTAVFSVVYDGLVLPHFIRLQGGAWKEGDWLLPVISEKPDRATMEFYFHKKKFAAFAQPSWNEHVFAFLNDIYPNASCIEKK